MNNPTIGVDFSFQLIEEYFPKAKELYDNLENKKEFSVSMIQKELGVGFLFASDLKERVSQVREF